jgi:hypothetical protein
LLPWYSDRVTGNPRASLESRWLHAGDVAVYLVATLLGFASHEELTPAAWERFLATFVPFVVAWFLISPWIMRGGGPAGSGLARLWRPLLAAFYAAPLGAWFRGLWLGAPVQIVFVAVMGTVTAALMVIWRAGLAPRIGQPN